MPRFGYFYHILSSIMLLVADLARMFLRIDHGHAWRFFRDLPIVAYRKLGDFKPAYRESHDTHGLSLLRG